MTRTRRGADPDEQASKSDVSLTEARGLGARTGAAIGRLVMRYVSVSHDVGGEVFNTLIAVACCENFTKTCID
jgi:hypothetical protein